MKFEADFGSVYFFLFFYFLSDFLVPITREKRSRQKQRHARIISRFDSMLKNETKSRVFLLVVFFWAIFRLKRVKGNHVENQYDRVLHSSRSFGLVCFEYTVVENGCMIEFCNRTVFLFLFFLLILLFRTYGGKFLHISRQFPLAIGSRHRLIEFVLYISAFRGSKAWKARQERRRRRPYPPWRPVA